VVFEFGDLEVSPNVLYDTVTVWSTQAAIHRQPTINFQLRILVTKAVKPFEAFLMDMTKPEARGKVLALDLGAKRVGIAASDELGLTANPLSPIQRGSWKQLLQQVRRLVEELGAGTLVIGLPLRLDGTEGEAARSARELAEKFRLSLSLPVHLQDERLTTFEAGEMLKASSANRQERADRIDSEAAAIILRDFINSLELKK